MNKKSAKEMGNLNNDNQFRVRLFWIHVSKQIVQRGEKKRNFVFMYKLSKYLADSFLLTTELSFGKKKKIWHESRLNDKSVFCSSLTILCISQHCF